MNPSVSSLLSFLPPHSFVMGKGKSTPQETLVSSGMECPFCGDRSHHAEMTGSPGADVVFLVESESFKNSKEEQLLAKICEAMKIAPEQAAVLVRSPGVLGDWSSCMPFQWKELKLRGPRILIALGQGIGSFFLQGSESPSRLRGVIHKRFDLNILVTEELTGMIENPNLKKQAWEDLKLALKIIKV